MTVYYSYDTEIKIHNPYRKIVDDVIGMTLKELNCPYEAEVSVTFVDDEGIRELNREYRGLDRSTDVLSFPLNEYEAPGDFASLSDDAFNPETGELMLGDIVLSVEHIISQAEEYGHTRKRELAFLTCHSVLHLCGYDHMEDGERVIMEELQNQILDNNGYRRKPR